MTEAIYSIAITISILGLLVLLACTAKDRSGIARAIGDIAAEVCVEGDSVSVCLRKCETEASRRGE